jgi:hypothetical protein
MRINTAGLAGCNRENTPIFFNVNVQIMKLKKLDKFLEHKTLLTNSPPSDITRVVDRPHELCWTTYLGRYT